VLVSQCPLDPSDLLHFLFPLTLIFAALQVPAASHLGLVTQTLAVPAGLVPHCVPTPSNSHLLLQQRVPATVLSHDSLVSRAPFPQRDVAVWDAVPVTEVEPETDGGIPETDPEGEAATIDPVPEPEAATMDPVPEGVAPPIDPVPEGVAPPIDPVPEGVAPPFDPVPEGEAPDPDTVPD